MFSGKIRRKVAAKLQWRPYALFRPASPGPRSLAGWFLYVNAISLSYFAPAPLAIFRLSSLPLPSSKRSLASRSFQCFGECQPQNKTQWSRTLKKKVYEVFFLFKFSRNLSRALSWWQSSSFCCCDVAVSTSSSSLLLSSAVVVDTSSPPRVFVSAFSSSFFLTLQTVHFLTKMSLIDSLPFTKWKTCIFLLQ